jgi:hypothetical protein
MPTLSLNLGICPLVRLPSRHERIGIPALVPTAWVQGQKAGVGGLVFMARFAQLSMRLFKRNGSDSVGNAV